MLGAWMYFPRTSSLGHHQPSGYAPGIWSICAGGKCPLLALMYISIAVAICRMLLAHCTVAALRRALFSAGNTIPINNAMMPMTTSSSRSVNAADRRPVRTRARSMHCRSAGTGEGDELRCIGLLLRKTKDVMRGGQSDLAILR